MKKEKSTLKKEQKYIENGTKCKGGCVNFARAV